MEPLKTDEPLPPGFKREKNDFESQILAGCSVFVAGSLTTYFLSIWPMLVFQGLAQLNVMLWSLAAGLGPAFVFGIFLCRKAGLAGGCAFCAGSLTVSVFIYLRFEQIVIDSITKAGMKPEYPTWLGWLIPLLWSLTAVGATLIALPRSEFGDKPQPAQ